MAESNTRKKASSPSGSKASTPKGNKPAARKSSSNKDAMTVTTAASTKPGAKASGKSTSKSPSGSTSRSGSKSQTAKKTAAATAEKSSRNAPKKQMDSAQIEAKLRRRNLFVEQFLPYILVAIGLFLIACFVLDAISEVRTPAEHQMGAVGFYICKFLFGSLGWAAYLIPLLLVNLVIFWKRYCREDLIPLKAILSLVVVVLISGLVHVIICAKNPNMAQVSAGYLFDTGYDFESGGVIGGYLGYVLFLGLRLPGTVVLMVLALPLLLMCLVGVTPAFVFGKLGNIIKSKWATAAEEREERRARREAEEEARSKLEESDAYRSRRAAMDHPVDDPASTSAKPATADATEEIPAAAPAEQASTSAQGSRRYARLDKDTGEVLEEPLSEAPATVSSFAGKREEEEQITALPFYEVSAVGNAENDDDEPPFDVDDPEDAEDTANVDSYEVEADGDDPIPVMPKRATTLFLPDEGRRTASEDTENMEVDYDDDYEDEETDASVSSPGVGYEVVTAAEQIPKKSDTPVTTVRILKTDTSALTDTGLSDEEVIHPTTFDDPEGDSSSDSEEREYLFPTTDLLVRGPSRYEANDEEIAANTQLLREVLESFNIRVKEISCSCGPTITRFEVKPEAGIRVRAIANLVDDISMNLAKAGVRIEAPIPGKAAVGIEVPNADPSTVFFRNILETPEFRNHKSHLAACLGADVSGRPVIMDINKMPHLLVAGTTGSGKSVCINSIIMSILYKAKPDEVKLILIDPKKVEFAVYRDLPHLYCPLLSDPQKAAGALNSAVNEMERRFGLIEEVGVRNIASYNEITAGDPARPPLPQMVIIIDELADLMMTASNDVETAICRLAQKGRAAGMHLILGTQRPSTDVITGLIKANVPSRIAFTVKQQIDSRIILDAVGAEKLIGRGDMLFAPVGVTKPLRVQGALVSDGEVERVVSFIRDNNERGEFDESFTREIEIETAKCMMNNKKKGEQISIEDFDGLGAPAASKEDAKLWEAMEFVVGQKRIGTSAFQRHLGLGYGRAAKIIDRMEEMGFIGPDDGKKQGRPVYLTASQLAEYKMNGLPGSGDGRNGGDDGDGE